MSHPSSTPTRDLMPIAVRDTAHFYALKAEIEGQGHRWTAFRAMEGCAGQSQAWCVHCRYLALGHRDRTGAILHLAWALFLPCLGNPLTDGNEPPPPPGSSSQRPAGGPRLSLAGKGT